MLTTLFGGCKTRPVIGCIGRVLSFTRSMDGDEFVPKFESKFLPFDQWHHHNAAGRN